MCKRGSFTCGMGIKCVKGGHLAAGREENGPEEALFARDAEKMVRWNFITG
jgi:hypothetical protein